jgi:hypothetical protein
MYPPTPQQPGQPNNQPNPADQSYHPDQTYQPSSYPQGQPSQPTFQSQPQPGYDQGQAYLGQGYQPQGYPAATPQPPLAAQPRKKNWFQRHIVLTIIAGVVAFIILVSAISSGGSDSPTVTEAQAEQSTETTNGSAASADQAPAVEEPDEQPPADGVYTFGQTVTFDNGNSLTVTAPEEFALREVGKMVNEPTGTPMKVQITFVNGTNEAIDPLIAFHITAASDGADAPKLFDSETLGDDPNAKILPGKSVTWTNGFDAQNPADMQVDITFSNLDTWDQQEATFTNG